MDTMTAEPVAPATPPANKMMCGYCAAAPLHRDSEGAHALCPGTRCICSEDGHQPTERVLIYQAGSCFWDYRLVADVAETWTWVPDAMETARRIRPDRVQRLHDKATSRSAIKSRRRMNLDQEVDSETSGGPASSSTTPSATDPSSSESDKAVHERTKSQIEQLVELVPQLDDTGEKALVRRGACKP